MCSAKVSIRLLLLAHRTTISDNFENLCTVNARINWKLKGRNLLEILNEDLQIVIGCIILQIMNRKHHYAYFFHPKTKTFKILQLPCCDEEHTSNAPILIFLFPKSRRPHSTRRLDGIMAASLCKFIIFYCVSDVNWICFTSNRNRRIDKFKVRFKQRIWSVKMR